jgi:hypothetical protein
LDADFSLLFSPLVRVASLTVGVCRATTAFGGIVMGLFSDITMMGSLTVI